MSVVLLLVASGLRTGEPLARQLASAVGFYYVLLGVATYYFAQTRHVGLLVFSGLGVALLATLWFGR